MEIIGSADFGSTEALSPEFVPNSLDHNEVCQAMNGRWTVSHPRGLESKVATQTDACAAPIDQLQVGIRCTRRSNRPGSDH
ncbi:hypothetical protein ACFXK0_20090 [Nocardia sp. NPDC059177]|uniref:hypothetical protein n=1 Tax=Nocardia sp. NPDC059177 TaxID=3346759 RepID=UPI003692A972